MSGEKKQWGLQPDGSFNHGKSHAEEQRDAAARRKRQAREELLGKDIWRLLALAAFIGVMIWFFATGGFTTWGNEGDCLDGLGRTISGCS